METQIKDLGGIIYSVYEQTNTQGEQFIGEHYVALIISGTMRLIDGERTSIFESGDMVFLRKNNLNKFAKQPVSNGYFKAITVILDKKSLMDFHKEQPAANTSVMPETAVFAVEQDNLLSGYFNSLADYFQENVSVELVSYKKQELIHLLLRKDQFFKNILFDFAPPGKIDLESFMQRNFKFNVGLDRLAFLTGRSLATFKRDFEKIFNLPPNRWLQQRRLKEAHYLLVEKHLKPSEVYLEVGFESLPHFSYAFKQFFGKTPSAVKA